MALMKFTGLRFPLSVSSSSFDMFCVWNIWHTSRNGAGVYSRAKFYEERSSGDRGPLFSIDKNSKLLLKCSIRLSNSSSDRVVQVFQLNASVYSDLNLMIALYKSVWCDSFSGPILSFALSSGV